jgi:hypothetical protein
MTVNREPRRLRQAGMSRLAIHGCRGPALVAHILARNGVEGERQFLSVRERLAAGLRGGLQMRRFSGSGKDQSFARGDAGAAEIAGNFLMDIH